MMKKRLKKIAVIFATLLVVAVTLYALLGAWENWSGARKWQSTKAKLTREGVVFDYRKLLPKMPPEDQNFVRTPLLASVTDFTHDRPEDMASIVKGTGEIIYRNPELRDRFLKLRLPVDDSQTFLPAVEKHRRADLSKAPDISSLLEELSAELAEIDEAALRTESQLKVDIGETFLDQLQTTFPYLQDLQKFQKLQVLRACLALEAGDTTQAKSSLLVLLQMGKASMSHPSLIGFLFGQAIYSSALSVVWEGMASGAWSDDDLVWIQNKLTDHQDILSRLETALQFELATFQLGACDFMKAISLKDSRHVVNVTGAVGNSTPSPSLGIFARLAPAGIWDHNKVFIAEMMFAHAILPVRNRTLPDTDEFNKAIGKRTPRNFLAAVTLPSTTSVTLRCFQVSTVFDLAILACGVERFRLQTGKLPVDLPTLIPDYIAKIPDDVMDAGQSLKYVKEGDGTTYRVYSVGKNRIDNDGMIAFKNTKTPVIDKENGDWVWTY
ncbi:MAG: hypothetical protein P1V20_14660 [Verrucomicrobiales bacterium]|nr:hypothetical protein [Verrucomicrobiales bacterium]